MIDGFLRGCARQTLEHDPGTSSLRATAPEFKPQAAQMIHSHHAGSYLEWRQIQLTDLFAHKSWPLFDHLPLQAQYPVPSEVILSESTTDQLQASRPTIRHTDSRSRTSGKQSRKHIELGARQKSFESSSTPYQPTKPFDRNDESQDGPLIQIVTPIVPSVSPFSAQLDYIARQTSLLDGTSSINSFEQL
jgi:hypothetical protein